jgi:1-acyl-sn-glycerol-3-phosphate acyltransferase
MTLLRSLLFNIVYFTTTFAMALYGVIACHSQERAFRLSRAWGRTSLFLARALCGMRLEVSGLEHVPQEGPALIACGHQSAFDTMVWLVLLPRTAYVMKQEVGRIPLFGALTLRAGMISVDREAGAAAIRALARAARSAAAAGRQIVIFPQGTRVAPGDIVALQPCGQPAAGHSGANRFRASVGQAAFPQARRHHPSAHPAAAARRARPAGTDAPAHRRAGWG